MIKYCECGCGKEVKRRFLQGHNARGVKKTDESNKKRSESLKGHKVTAETREKIRKANIGKILSQETRDKFSIAAKRNWANGIYGTETFEKISIQNSRGRSGYYKNIFMRSNVERRYAAQLDRKGIEWQYEPKRFDLGELGTYTPDFYLPETDSWSEVKYTIDSEKDIEKMKTFQKMGNNVALILEKDVKLLEQEGW